MQLTFREDNLELHYIDTNIYVFVISFKRSKGMIEVSKNFEDYLDFSNLDPSHELYSNINKKNSGKKAIDNIF